MAVSLPHVFVNGTAADADQVNQNFDALVVYVNENLTGINDPKPFTSDVDFSGYKLLRVGTPTASTDGANKAYVDNSVIPVGVIQMFGGPDNKIPAKWVKCDGRQLVRATYSELFNVIGSGYGPGDGVSTFNVPNFTSKFPYGAAPGATGGFPDSIVVAHQHTYYDNYRSVSSVVASGSSFGYSPNLTTDTRATSQEGQSGSGRNIPPFLGATYMIRTGV